jgi:hypothetical protein
VSAIGCDWNKVDWKTKKTLYLAVTETAEIDMSKTHELDVYNLATTGMIDRRCIEAAKLYKELEALENLPSLRVKLGSVKAEKGQKGNNPFNLGKNRSI